MNIELQPATTGRLASLRELYRQSMNCQIIHDSLHARTGWTETNLLLVKGEVAGYASNAVGGPWTNRRTAFEIFLLPEFKLNQFEIFGAYLERTKPVQIETQSNDPLLTIMLHTFCKTSRAESILFEDAKTTNLHVPRSSVRRVVPGDTPLLADADLDSDANWALEFEGQLVGTGGILFHYNRPFGDIYMKTAERFRRRGFGAFLIQELKRICREGGNVPAARCRVDNEASRKTLMKAGFTPCGHILVGVL